LICGDQGRAADLTAPAGAGYGSEHRTPVIAGISSPQSANEEVEKAVTAQSLPVEVRLLTKDNQKTPHLRGFFIGRPDLNRGPHRPRIMGKIRSEHRKALQIGLL
jgi:hypothetical protein